MMQKIRLLLSSPINFLQQSLLNIEEKKKKKKQFIYNNFYANPIEIFIFLSADIINEESSFRTFVSLSHLWYLIIIPIRILIIDE